MGSPTGGSWPQKDRLKFSGGYYGVIGHEKINIANNWSVEKNITFNGFPNWWVMTPERPFEVFWRLLWSDWPWKK